MRPTLKRVACCHDALPVLQKSGAHTQQQIFIGKGQKSHDQCTNIVCSASFRAMTAVDKIIQSPALADLSDDEFIVCESGKIKKQRFH